MKSCFLYTPRDEEDDAIKIWFVMGENKNETNGQSTSYASLFNKINIIYNIMFHNIYKFRFVNSSREDEKT